MGNNRNDILSIEQYLRGELDARAMHIFERATLDDPFLADALEGYAAREGQQANVNTLRERLRNRVSPYIDEAKPFNLRLLLIAIIAIIGFALVAAWWILVHTPQTKKAAIQQGIVPTVQQQSVIITAPADTTKKDTAKKLADHKADTLRTDSAGKKRVVLDKIPSPDVAPGAPRKRDIAVGTTVHPSTVIADLNKWPYGSRKKAALGQAVSENTEPSAPVKPATDKPVDGKPLVATPASAAKLLPDKTVNVKPPTNYTLTNRSSDYTSTTATPVAKKVVILKGQNTETQGNKDQSALQQFFQKNSPTTVIIPPKGNESVETVSVKRDAPPAVALTTVPTGIAAQDSATLGKRMPDKKKQAGNGINDQTAAPNTDPDAGMNGRDISSLRGGPTAKNTAGGPSAQAAVKTEAQNLNRNMVRPDKADSDITFANNVTNATAPKAKKPSGKDRVPILLQGRVVSILTGQPVAKVVMWNKTEDIQHRLEADGEFDIVAHKGDEIYVGRSGYKTQRVKVKSRKRFDIIMEEVNSTLYDGYLRGLNFTPFDDTAHPAIGWERLAAYQKLKATDGKTGTVKVKFTINRDNSLSNIKIEDSVSAAADSQAVKVIRDQLKWVHNTNNQPETITVKFKVE